MQPEQYSNHAVWTTLDSVTALLSKDLQSWDEGSRYSVRRLRAAAEFVDWLRDVDPVLVEPQALNDLQSHLQSLHNALGNYLKSPGAEQFAHLDAAAATVPNILQVGRDHFPLALPDEAGRAVKGAATRYRNSLDAEVERLQSQITGLLEQLTQAQSAREQDQLQSTQQIADLTQVVEQRTAALDALEVKLQAQIDEQRNSFVQESESRAAAFKQSQQAQATTEQERIDAAVAAEAQRLTDVLEGEEASRTALLSEAAELITALEPHRDQAKALADTTSRHAVAGEYGKWAARQARAAFIWTILAVLIGLGVVASLVVAIETAADDTFQFTLYKASISVIGLIVAGYAARQASEHRREERTAKRLALDLAALGPFLEQVDDAEPLRQAVAKRVFAPDPEGFAGEGTRSQIRIRGRSMNLSDILELVQKSQGN